MLRSTVAIASSFVLAALVVGVVSQSMFPGQLVITTAANYANSVFAIDLDGDSKYGLSGRVGAGADL